MTACVTYHNRVVFQTTFGQVQANTHFVVRCQRFNNTKLSQYLQIGQIMLEQILEFVNLAEFLFSFWKLEVCSLRFAVSPVDSTTFI